MTVQWLGAEADCTDDLLDGNTCLTGTPVYLIADVQMVAKIVEVYEERLRKHFKDVVKENVRDVSTQTLNQVHGNVVRTALPWSLPGPSQDSPKGEGTFRFPFVDATGSPQWSPVIKSSAFGYFQWSENAQAPGVSGGIGVTRPGGISLGPHFKIDPNKKSIRNGIFKASVDPTITAELLVPGNGLESYLSDYLHWMGGDDVDDDVNSIVNEIVSISADSGFEASIDPSSFNIEERGWQDISLSVSTGDFATFFAAIRFTSQETGDTYVSDLLSVSTQDQPIPTNQIQIDLEQVAKWQDIFD